MGSELEFSFVNYNLLLLFYHQSLGGQVLKKKIYFYLPLKAPHSTLIHCSCTESDPLLWGGSYELWWVWWASQLMGNLIWGILNELKNSKQN